MKAAAPFASNVGASAALTSAGAVAHSARTATPSATMLVRITTSSINEPFDRPSILLPQRQIVAVAPFFPRAVVVAQVVVADEVQREQIDRRAHADLAVRDHLL